MKYFVFQFTLLLLHSMQVDRLTKRAKHSESAYLEVYQSLYEAPDPSSYLTAGTKSASRISELEVHIRKQAQELAEYMAEAEGIKNQDLTIRKLEDKVKLKVICRMTNAQNLNFM